MFLLHFLNVIFNKLNEVEIDNSNEIVIMEKSKNKDDDSLLLQENSAPYSKQKSLKQKEINQYKKEIEMLQN